MSRSKELLRCHEVIAKAKRAGKLRGYPAFYTLENSLGLGLFAKEGKHHGAGFGSASSQKLILYGVDNFAKRGGLAWQKYGERTYYTPRFKQKAESA